MGWWSESTAFHCKPGLLPSLRKALGGIRTTARAEDLWCRVLEELGDSQQGRTSLSRLLQEQPGPSQTGCCSACAVPASG